MSLPAVGRPRSRTERQTPDVPQKSCMKTENRKKLPKADGNKPILRRQSLAPICTPVGKPSTDTPKLSGVDFPHQKHTSICGKTGLSRPTIKNVCDIPTATQLSKRSKVASESLLDRAKLDRRQTPEKCSKVFGSIVHGFTKDVLSSSDEDELYRQYLTDQGRSNGLAHRQKFPSEFNTEDEKYGHSIATKMSQKELELMHYQQALLEQMMNPTFPENCIDLKSRTGKKSNKKNSKRGKDRNIDIESSPCQQFTEQGHKFEDLPLLRQSRLKVSVDPDAAVPEEAQYIPTPPGFEKIPCRLVPNMGVDTSPASRKVRFNTVAERGTQRRD
ncbi:uncharacterized protein LOC117331912 [Pecten maximus]|uniref:uncharacterized protein LOC117331912 n=1 Tax=Pecten maximus TaxID=6579 RepID=UPI001458A103|nr:uncharacterized protein LOC117331912 [Pecten maximus]